MTILFGTDDKNDELFLGGSGVGIAVGLGGDDTIVSPLNAVAPGSQLFGNKGEDSIRSRGVGDTCRGGQDDDNIVNESGFAFLFGDLGDDTVEGREGSSTIFGGAGDDSVVGAGPKNLIFGDLLASFSLSSADTVPGNDTMLGLVGGDTMVGGGGNDYIKGGPKESSWLFGNQGKDSLYAGADQDSLYGGKDADYMIVGSDAAANEVLFVGGDGSDKLLAFNGDKHIMAGDAEGTTLAGDDYLWVTGGEGHILFGNMGNDKLIYGGSGSVTLFGGQDDDSLYASGDGGLFSGDKGSDYLSGSGVNNSTLDGGIGTWSDTISLSSGKGNLLVGDNGSDASDDFLYVLGSGATDGNNTLAGGAGNDYLFSKGGNGSDANVLTGAEGDDTYFFGKGDTITPDKDGKNVYFGFAGAEAVKVTVGVNDVILPGASGQYTFEGGLPTVAFVGTGGVVTGDGKDFVSIDNAASETNTKGGNDTLTVGMLSGGTINAGAGDDVLTFAGTDNKGDIFLGSGNDTLDLPAFQGGSIGGNLGDDVFNIDTILAGNVDGGAGNDLMNIEKLGGDTDTETPTLSGGVDNDTISVAGVGSGGGALSGGAGNDILLGGTNPGAVGSDSGAVTLTGGDGNDFLRGRQYGQDLLEGGAGDDIISGGLAADITAKLGGAITAGSSALLPLIEAAANPQGDGGDLFDGDTLTGGAGKDIFVIATQFETGFWFNQLNPGGMGLAGADAKTVFGTGAITAEDFAGKGFFADKNGTTNGLLYDGIQGVDTVTDFKSGEDRIAIFQEASFGFTGLGTGASFNTISFGTLIGVANETAFTAFAGSTDVGDVVFDSSTGGVYIGAGGSAVLVAVLDNVTSLAETDVLFTTKAAVDAGITFF
ncbi:MAG TPA: calcium-binding protein [Oscillatoriales cyanobacterium M4454_W2019_049]|nr:calcium-binding protein [Oscillatoriales cyanobacterium M4454_W2019_049]